jgi:hypothetical protein
MKRPYTITKNIWDDFYRVQMSGSMNMMGHPYVGYFFDNDAYDAAYNHFQTDGETADLEIQ